MLCQQGTVALELHMQVYLRSPASHVDFLDDRRLLYVGLNAAIAPTLQ